MALGRATVLVSDSSVRLPATIARWVERRARASERAERPRDGSRDARERRGNGDGDGEIGGASRARGVGFVDAKKKKEEEDEDAGLTFVGLQSSAGVYAVPFVERDGASMRSMRLVREDDFASRSAETVPEAYSSLAARRFVSSRS